MRILSNLRFARRSLARNPLVTAAAVVTLGLGIGANTTLFSFIKAHLVDPFHYRDQKNTVLIWSANSTQRNPKNPVSIPAFRDWGSRASTFDHIAISSPVDLALTSAKEPERISGIEVSEDFFWFFNATPLLGRWFTSDEYSAGANHTVVISHAFWKSHFASDPNAVGKVLRLDGAPYRIAGIAGASFWFPTRYASMWLPLPKSASDEDRNVRKGFVLAHLRPGITIQQANDDLAGISHELAKMHPGTESGWSAHAYNTLEGLMEENDLVTVTLAFGVVGALLIIACSNVANLLLAQAAMRRRELAIRTAIGATRWRLFSQSFTESFLLAAMGGVAGLLAGLWARDLLIAVFPTEILISHPSTDPFVLGFCVVVSILAALIFGTVPAWHGSRIDPVEGLKESRGVGARTHRLASAFVCAQIALSTILLIVTGLLLQTMVHLQHLDLGFRPHNLAIARLHPSRVRHATDDNIRRFYRAALNQTTQVPGVLAVSATSAVPVLEEGLPVRIELADGHSSPAEHATALAVAVGPTYFHTTGITLQRGREFTLQDDEQSARVVVVNQAFGARFFPGDSAIGRRVRTGDSTAPWTIVGIADNVRSSAIRQPAHPQVYMPFLQSPRRDMTLLVRTASDPGNVMPVVRRAIASVDKDEPVESNTMHALFADAVRAYNILVEMFAIFAGLGLAMAAVGLFALIAYSVNERTREIGIRMALGARAADVVRLVVRRGLGLAAAGVLVGLLVSAGLSRLMVSVLIEVRPWDPTTFLTVIAVLLAIAALASYVPARRALRTNPLTALKAE